jgi:hypothetical protein
LLALGIAAQKKGYALVPHYNVAPRDITSSVSEDNIIIGRRRANKIVMEPSANDPLSYSLSYSQAIHSESAIYWISAIDHELQNMERHTVWSIRPLIPGCNPI